jgi:DNA-binding transcriptional LysR family regulator
MNLQQLRYVVATVDAGTMTAAAGQLNVAQPALSRAIKALERELQIQIFEPAGRGVRLTAAGEDVVRAARAVLAGVDEVGSVARSHARRAEPLAVVTTPTLEPLFARHFTSRGTPRPPSGSNGPPAGTRSRRRCKPVMR